jgi:hypothetical protein
MKSVTRKLTCAALLLGAPHLRAAPVVVDVAPEKQLQDLLCWAAVSSMAVNAFGPDGVAPRTQRELARLGRQEMLRIAGARVVDWNVPTMCEGQDIKNCNITGYPMLPGLDFEQVETGKMLPDSAIALDVGARRKPVLIMWDYTEARPRTREGLPLPAGRHVLIVTAYDATSTKKRIRIYDPWPTQAVEDQAAKEPRRERWISYQRFSNPKTDHGQVALHRFAHYKLRKQGQAISPWRDTDYGVLATDANLIPAMGTPVTFGQARVDSNPPLSAHMRALEVYDSDGSPVLGPFGLTEVVPIIVLTTRELIEAGSRPQSLLQDRTNAVMAVVVSNREVVDSFMVVHERSGWVVDGYNSNQIAYLAETARLAQSIDGRSGLGFYLVSVPEQGAFYLGYGFGDSALLLPLANQARGPMLRADKVLNDLMTGIRKRMRRPSN